MAERVALWLCIAVILAGSALTIWWPMGRDQGIFAWIGETIADGGIPYRDAWDIKGPTTFLQYAAVHSIFGRNMHGIRIADLALMVAAGWAVYVIAAGAFGPPAGWWAIVFLFATIIRTGFWNTAQPDLWAGLLGVISIALLFRLNGQAWLRGLLAGMLLAWVMLYKPPVFLLFPLVVIAAVIAGRDGSVSSRERWALLWSSIGGALLLVGGVTLWLGIRGGLGDAWYTLFIFNSQMYSGFDPIRPALAGAFAANVVRADYVMGVAGLIWLGGVERRLSWLLLAWVGAATVVVLVQARLFTYHWAPLLPIMAIGAGVTVAGLLREARRLRGTGSSGGASHAGALTALLIGLVALTIVPSSTFVARHWARLLPALTSGDMRPYYEFHEFGIRDAGDFSAAPQVEVAAYLSEVTEPSDYVLVWGHDPLINYLAGRRSPTRYGLRFPVTRALEAAPDIGAVKLDTLMADLRARPPAYFVVVHNDLNPFFSNTSADALQSIDVLAEFLSRHYHYDRRIERFELYRFVDAPLLQPVTEADEAAGGPAR